jgi:hypothetical protein
MRASLRWLPAAAVCVTALAAPSAGLAAPPDPRAEPADEPCPRVHRPDVAGADPDRPGAPCGRDAAAALYDRAVRDFQQAEFVAAARGFLEADAAAPSVDAVKNAMVAARRGADFELLVEAGRRASTRADAEVAKLGREAVIEASAHLARLTLRCSGACVVELDGAPTSGGEMFALPGTHRIAARSPSGARSERVVSCDAGMAYTYDLDPVAAFAAQPAGRSVAPSPLVVQSAATPGGASPALFYASLGLTAALTGLVVASGVDAVAAKDDLPNPPTTAERDDVLGRAHRTDALLGGALAAGALSAALAIWVVRWPSSPRARAAAACAFTCGSF